MRQKWLRSMARQADLGSPGFFPYGFHHAVKGKRPLVQKPIDHYPIENTRLPRGRAVN